MSAIFYRFKSQRTDSRLPIDGTGISVFDLKKEIILANHMGDGKEFDLGLYDGETEQEYKDDHFMIPRSTSVIARRLPPARPGKGTAAIYVAGTEASAGSTSSSSSRSAGPARGGFGGGMRGGFASSHMQKRFDGKDAAPAAQVVPTGASFGGDDEASRLASMFAAEAEQWNATKETMANATPVYASRGGRGGGAGRGGFQRPNQADYMADKPLPPGYICYRCGQRGHWIQACPTNEDKEFDNKPRFKRTTGIPRSFLKTVEAPAGTEGASGGVMITPEGGFVVAEPDIAAWEKQRAKPKIVTESEVREESPPDATLACPICSKLFSQAVETPCCSTTYCEECIQAHLLEHDFICPGCDSKLEGLDGLKEDKEMRERVQMFIAEEIERRSSGEEKASSDDDKNKSATPAPALPDFTGVPLGPSKPTENEAFLMQQQQQQLEHMQMLQSLPNPQVLQGQIGQMMMMLQNPQLPPQARMQLNMNVQSLTQQLQLVQSMMQQAMAFGNGPHMQQLGAAGAQSVQQQSRVAPSLPAATAPVENITVAPGSERLLVNSRRRGLKREAPASSGDGGAAKYARM